MKQTTTKHTFTLLSAFLLALPVGCAPRPFSVPESETANILDVFPQSVAQVPADERGRTAISSTYAPSGSLWAEGLDERQVFQIEMRHQQDADNSFALRVGKGGQIYSLRGAFGESVPPSSKQSPWNDEVWQFVSVCLKYNGLNSLLHAGKLPDEVVARFKSSPYKQSYFIHNSGAYIPGGSSIQSLYCPLLGSTVTDDGRTYRTINWGLVPQVRTMQRSPILYYTQVRDVGDGVIELTWVVHNFSVRDDVVFDWLNAPWGGTRMTSLPVHYISSPVGELKSRESFIGKNLDGVVDVRKTGGWNLACASEAPDSPSLALVFGRDKHLETEMQKAAKGEPHCQLSPSWFRDFLAHYPQMYEKQWKDWRTRPENSFRNYDVIEVVPKLRLAPGTTIWYRSFLVVNRKDKIVELAKSLVDKVDYGLVNFDPASTPLVPVFVRDGKVVEASQRAKPAFELYSKPLPGTMPVFLIENATTGQQVVTTDPYIFVPKEKLDFGVPPSHPQHDYYSHIQGYSLDKNNSRWKKLLGFAYVHPPAQGSYRQLSDVLESSLFPQTDVYHLNLWVKSYQDKKGN